MRIRIDNILSGAGGVVADMLYWKKMKFVSQKLINIKNIIYVISSYMMKN